MNNEKDRSEIARKVFTVRPKTRTRPAIRIVVSQNVDNNTGEIAMATATLTENLPTYFEKPDILEDMAMELICAAGMMRELNKKVVKVR